VIDPENKLSNLQHVTVLPAQSATQMVNAMQRADVVISACGQTLHELVALQKPTVGICLDIDQVPNQMFYIKHGFLSAKLEWNDKNLEIKIVEQLKYFSTLANRKSISEISKSLISKNGAMQIAKFINSLL
jgi:spore coat polysaccharide biosynthesis predicted glycosyltransferase SpsG